MPDTSPTPSKYDRLIAAARDGTPAVTIVAHPCDETSLRGAIDAAAAGADRAGPRRPGGEDPRRRRRARHRPRRPEIVDAPHSHAAAARAVALIREGKGELLMKGSLHTDELMRAVTASATGLRTERRISHVFVMDVPGHPETLFITDAAINIFPDLDAKRDIVQNAIDLWVGDRPGHAAGRDPLGGRDGDDEDPLDHRGGGALQDGRARPDHRRPARRPARLRQRHRPRGGADQGHHLAGRRARAQILVVPDLEAGNMLAKNLTFLAHADAAGIVLGARVPIILTSRADSRAHPARLLRGGGALRQRAPGASRGAGGLMQAILVVNAGSSSLKFQIFAHRRRPARASGAGPDRRHRRAAAPARPSGADGAALVDRSYRAGRAARPAGRHRRDSGAGCATPRAASSSAPSATASCTAARTSTGRCGSTRTCSTRLAALRAAGAAAPAEQPRADPAGAWRSTRTCRRSPASTPPSTAATRRTPTATRCRARSTTRACAATASTASPTSMSPSGCREVAPDDRRRAASSSPISAAAPRCARCADGRSVESTMGFTALDGLPMGTRPGQLDPGVVLYLIEQQGHERRGGHRPALQAAPASRASRASPTTCATCSRATTPAPPSPSTTSSTAAALNAGHARGRARRPRRLRLHRRHRRERRRRSAPASPSASPGSAPSSTPPPTTAGDRRISTPASRVALLVVPTDEELMIARHTLALVGAGHA